MSRQVVVLGVNVSTGLALTDGNVVGKIINLLDDQGDDTHDPDDARWVTVEWDAPLGGFSTIDLRLLGKEGLH